MGKADMVRLAMTGAFLAFCSYDIALRGRACLAAFVEEDNASAALRVAAVRNVIEDRFPCRMTFVELNGLFVRLIGQHACNGVLKTVPHGMLVNPSSSVVKVRKSARRMCRFAGFCRKRGVPFLYVQLPRKLDIGNRMLPAGVVDRSNRNADRLLKSAVEAGIKCIDLRADFAATPDDVSRNFYRTDHHWRNDAAFRAAGRLAKEIAARCGVSKVDASRAMELLSPDAWVREVRRECFLGSLGRRTGALFAGLDDLVVLRPRFATRMAMDIPSENLSLEGTFDETNMRRAEEALSEARSYTLDAYSALYVGGIYPQVVHENPEAPLGVRVLLVGDSFARPVEAFLSVTVRRLDVVDPRWTAKGFSLAEHVRQTKPDIVIQMLNPSSFHADTMSGEKTGRSVMFDYGL